MIVLDEPTTALDVTTQAHVLDTIRDLTKQYGVAALYVTHDLAVVANLADRIAFMYAGRIVEIGTKDELFDAGQHPYTRKLLSSIPDITGERALRGIPGWAPRPRAAAAGLRLHAALWLGDREVQRGVPAGRERQRVAIARGLAAEPTVLVCDEVTSWLDVSVQAAIIELLANLQREMGLSCSS